ncbi:nitroreductase family protein [Celeribacter indicus]|uniref:Nitroreductase domain-containing protein n=1 Tax=Celeribacter indicus TaxID=1208324 RepID=A0A0B5E3Q5_9RHOB|nr:nitroreductase family protein [Celeribacter indicus]AJE47037.1 hypothetical protein P73_2322 [Celeribacter indicus]SDW92404.1 Nitroreductase [Celeribacter indicus]
MPRTFPERRPPFRERLRLLTELIGNNLYDAGRFWRASFTDAAKTRENLRARIAIGLHFLEYGMSLRDTVQGRGLDRAQQLAEDVDTYLASFGPDATTEIALRTLESYLRHNAGAELDLSRLTEVVEGYAALERNGLRGGSEEVSAEDIRARGRMDFLSFAEARHSIRNYAPGPVPADSIERAVQVAQQSPSSCNRQTCRARIWTRPDACARILALQSGNRGFGDQLGGVAVITSDLAHWEQATERYQGWIDGGLFAMSFVYGLHAEGLGAVMLNWSECKGRDRELRRLIGLPESELIVTLIGFGNLPDTLRVPVSQRKPLSYAASFDQPLAE